jgi:hypothetical protein
MLGNNGFEKWYLGTMGPILGCHAIVLVVVVVVVILLLLLVVVVVVFSGIVHLELLPFWT